MKSQPKKSHRAPPAAPVVTQAREPLNPMGVNDEVLAIIRRWDKEHYKSESDEARITGITRPHVHNLHHDPVVLTIPLIVRWCNGSHVNFPALVDMGVERSCRKQAKTAAAGGGKMQPRLHGAGLR